MENNLLDTQVEMNESIANEMCVVVFFSFINLNLWMRVHASYKI